MPRLTARNKKIIANVVRRWAHTIYGTHPETVERVQKILDPVYRKITVGRNVKIKAKKKGERATSVWKTTRLKGPKIHVVRSPLAFRIAAGVLRGYVSKVDAKQMCRAYGIDDSFVDGLRRDSLLDTRRDPHWYRSSSALAEAWEKTLETPIRGAIQAVFAEVDDAGPQAAVLARRRSNRRRRQVNADEQMEKYQVVFSRALSDAPPVSRNAQIREIENNHVWEITKNTFQRSEIRGNRTTLGNFWQREDGGHTASDRLAHVPHSSRERSATHCRIEASGIDSAWGTNYIDAEILCEGMGFKHPEQTWQRELVHAAPMVMTFRTQALVCLGRPVVHKNRDGELHNDEGPAVVYPDGAKQYWVDGHALGVLGEKIVDKPELLTLEDISREPNEEIKRLAIEAYGWGRYLDEIGAKVVDRRENDVDNTIEALVEIEETLERSAWDQGSRRFVPEGVPIKRRKLVLACRSTARQYFLAVPAEIQTCEEGQQWLHAGASTDIVDTMNYPVRLLGAS